MKDIEVEFRNSMRYSTSGDYFDFGHKTIIQVYNQINDDYNFLIFIHEAIEQYLTERSGIKEVDIMAYDLQSNDDDPGSNPNAPYHKEHMISEKVERILAKFMGVNWKKYEQEIKVYNEQS